jgi:hypothetical protein
MLARNAIKPVTISIEITFNFWMLGAEKPIEHWDKRPSRPVIVRGDEKTAHGFSAMVIHGWLILFAKQPVLTSSALNSDLTGHNTNRASIRLERLQWRAPEILRR